MINAAKMGYSKGAILLGCILNIMGAMGSRIRSFIIVAPPWWQTATCSLSLTSPIHGNPIYPILALPLYDYACFNPMNTCYKGIVALSFKPLRFLDMAYREFFILGREDWEKLREVPDKVKILITLAD